MSVAANDEVAFADRHLQSVLSSASVAVGSNVDRVMLPPNLVTFLPVITLFAAVVIAGDVAARLDCLCWPAVDAACNVNAPLGLGAGLVGAAAVYASEVWRAKADDLDEASSKYSAEPCLVHTVLMGTWPLTLFARILAGDATVGERAADSVLTNESPLPGALLHLAGTTAACAWSQGVVQQSLDLGLTNYAIGNAMRLLPADMENAEWWWPLIAAGPAITPAVAALLAALITAAADTTVWRSLRPSATAVAAAQVEAVRVARERSESIFRLDAPATVAEQRAAAFDVAARRWEQHTRERDARFALASALRAVVAAVAYGVSGHSQIAPLLCGVLGGSRSVREVLSGKQ